MAIVFEKQDKSIIEILDGNKKDIISNINVLAKDYKDKTGRDLNKGCPSCIIEMVLTLKNHYKMAQFKFKRHAASYKNKKGDKTTISNATMTDEKAVEFLRTNPERIKLFSEFPSNWEQLLIDSVNAESEAEKEARLAIEAEMKASKEAKEEGKNGQGSSEENKEEVEEEKVEENDDVKAVEEEARLAAEAATSKEKPSREDLMKKQLKDLREKYPDIKATSKKDFVDKVLA